LPKELRMFYTVAYDGSGVHPPATTTSLSPPGVPSLVAAESAFRFRVTASMSTLLVSPGAATAPVAIAWLARCRTSVRPAVCARSVCCHPLARRSSSSQL